MIWNNRETSIITITYIIMPRCSSLIIINKLSGTLTRMMIFCMHHLNSLLTWALKWPWWINLHHANRPYSLCKTSFVTLQTIIEKGVSKNLSIKPSRKKPWSRDKEYNVYLTPPYDNISWYLWVWELQYYGQVFQTLSRKCLGKQIC